MRIGTWAVRSLGLAVVLAGLSSTAWAVDVPELDPGSMMAAMTLITGGLLMVTDRVCRKK